MDRVYDPSGNLIIHPTDFSLPDFIDQGGVEFNPFAFGDVTDPNGHVPVSSYVHDGGIIGDGQFGPVPGDMFGFEGIGIEDSNFVLDGFPGFGGEDVKHVMDGGVVDEDDDDDEEDDYSSATTGNTNSNATTTPSPRTPTKKAKVDRSRTLISERRRRGRMKEKLYALRALVPNITKMDKASIVGDAVLYMQDLQMQAKKLKAEIAGLEASIAKPQNHPGNPNSKKIHLAPKSISPAPRKIFQMDAFQVEERGFYVRIVSNRGVGVGASLYKALESLTSFIVQSSNLASSSSSDRFILTFTLNIKEGGPDMDLHNLRLWIAGSLLNHGFELVQTA